MDAEMVHDSSLEVEGARLPLSRENVPPISVIICTLNEEQCLPHVLPRIPSYVSEVILVDGHSTDRTVEVAKGLRADIKVFLQPGKGKGTALRYGFQHAVGDIIVTLDADGTTDPEEMDNFVRPLLQGYDFVKGSRFRRSRAVGMPRHRVFGNWVLATTANVLFGTCFTDICSGYNAFWRSILQRVDFESGAASDVESTLSLRVVKARLKILEVAHQDNGRVAGESKMPSLREGWNNLTTIVRERVKRG
ncbi:MAG: glycosyltransferase family 2 protein [Dehalococcoidia bacterium]